MIILGTNIIRTGQKEWFSKRFSENSDQQLVHLNTHNSSATAQLTNEKYSLFYAAFLLQELLPLIKLYLYILP